MITIENVEAVGVDHAIRGMRNPKNSWDRSDSLPVRDDTECTSTCVLGDFDRCDDCYLTSEAGVIIGIKDYGLMNKLAKGGPVHAKYRRMIVVYLDITAPLYWWKEFDTYKVGTVANSCSTMHKIHENVFTLEDFSFEHLLGGDLAPLVQDHNDDLNAWSPSQIASYMVSMLNACRLKYLELDEMVKNGTDKMSKDEAITLRKQYWWQMIQLLPSSYNQKRTIMLNYEVLAGMYKWRKNHKLDEWREFCRWIENLPYSEIITGGN